MRDIKADLDFDDKSTTPASPTVTAANNAAPAAVAPATEVPQPVGEARPPRENPSA
jgi:hypothetical protein